jgi:Leucine-rich repeat (LRR) protein
MAKKEKKELPEALRRIEDAERSGADELDLSELELTAIPESLSRMANLRRLNLSGNQLTTIPESLSRLSELKSLYLAGNQITTIPESIAALSKLESLNLWGNQITTIPESLSRLSELKSLDLTRNQITTIPESIAALSKLERLRLWENQITTIPESLSRLWELKSLDLSFNRITTIPESLSRLSDLKLLDLSSNQITTIPESLSRLSELMELDLASNQITTIPESLSRLSELKWLDLSFNQITTIPESLSQLTKLENLDLARNQITTIPESLSQLTKLEALDLSANQITVIPRSFSRLKNLQKLDLSGNPLPDELMAAAARGVEAFLRYLESVEARAAHPRTVKLVLLGEPGAGKTTLLEALKGNPHPCDPNRKETVGVNVATVDKKSPQDGQALHLSVWDFAGQHMEHATHQPFLTENALFLVLWNARMGTGAGKRDLWYWLELLKMRVREPKFLLVATHTEFTPPDLNLTEIQRNYGGCQGNFAVEFDSLAGFDALEGKILELAAASPALKAVWPMDWLPVRDRIRELRASRPQMSREEFRRLMEEQGVRDAQQQRDLAEQLHQLGEILYFQELKGLSGLVILSPAWLTELIARVVRSEKARKCRGVLHEEDLDELWQDHELSPEVREHLVRLMDHFDLTYSTVDAEDSRIVVEALPYSTPEELERIKLPAGQPEMEMIFRFPTLDRHLPPGIPTWGIARAHRLARQGLGPWRDAAFFEDADTDSRALILASDTAKEVRLKVTADYPPFFLGRMEAILSDTFRRYKELVPERRLPCRCRPGCTFSYVYEVVVGRRNSKKTDITCGDSGKDVPLDSLLMGYSPTTAAGRRAEEAERRRYFTTLIRAMNEQIEKTCPSVFTLAPSLGFKQLPTFWETFTGAEELDLCLYCEDDSGWHTTPHSIYRFLPDKEWIDKLKAHWRPFIAISLHVAPLARAVGWAADVVAFHALGEAAEGLHGPSHPPLSPIAAELGRQESPKLIDIRTREVLKELIDHLDSKRPPGNHYGGLHRHIVEDGRLLWLCPDHLEAYQTK